MSHPPLSCLFAQLRFGGLDSKPQRPAEIARAAHLQPLLPSFKLPELSLESLTGAAATPLDFSRAKGSLSGRWRCKLQSTGAKSRGGVSRAGA